jgi:hypothetical protein
MKPNTLFQVRFRPSVTPPRGWTHSAHYNVLNYDKHHNKYLIGKTWLPAKYFIKIEVQDAPVFDKPVLRTIKSLKENECIEIPNDTILDLVLLQAERECIKWDTGIEVLRFKPETPCSIAFKYKGEFYGMSYSSIGFHKQQKDTILPASKFVEVPQEKEEPITEPQKEDCKAADERIKELEEKLKNYELLMEQQGVRSRELIEKSSKEKVELESLCELRLQDNDGLADECEKWKTMLTATNQHIDKLRDICQIASTTGSKEIMQSVLKSIARGEI